MKCEKCNAEGAAGETYTFFYGTHLGIDYPNRRTTVTRYRLVSSEDHYLCDGCVDAFIEARARRYGWGVSLTFLGIPVCFLLLSLVAFQGDLSKMAPMAPVGMFIAAMAVLGPLMYLTGKTRWKVGETRKWLGDKLAIDLRKEALKKEGMSAFFTRQERAALI
jgi:hypothetical protein